MSLPKWTLCLATPLFLVTGLEAQDQDLRERVRATFDPQGAFDPAVKLPELPTSAADADRRAPGAPDPTGGSGFGGPTQTSSGGPANDDCGDATIIPGNVVTYSNTVFTGNATVQNCESDSDCSFLNVGWTVWYSYTPDQDGQIFIDTFGSNYDTELAVYLGCAIQGPIFCFTPDDIICNNDYFFGEQSQVILDVEGGTTYIIRAAGIGGGGTLDLNLRYLPPNDICVNAMQITGTAFDPPLMSTHNADTDTCEAQESCEFNGVGTSNTVWYSYVPPCDGLISINTNGSSYDTVVSVFDGCAEFVAVDASCIFPTEIGCDDDSGTGLDSQLIDVPVNAGTEYLIKVADYNTSSGGGWLDFNFVFDGANPPVADITSPTDFSCACNSLMITGSANAGPDSYVDWELEYKVANGAAWVPLASGTNPVENDFLAAWNTDPLPQGHHLVRLTVRNACGLTSTDVAVVFIDETFADAELRQPTGNLVQGGLVCLDGTAWDQCFDNYQVDYRPAGGGAWTPIGQSPYPSTVINDPLGPGSWDSTAVADGTYDVRLRATDQCGNVGQEIATLDIDNTPPTALIQFPENCDRVEGVVNVTGVATDANLDYWVLQYTGGPANGWVTLGQGSDPVNGGTLRVWDTSALPNCAYTLRLVVFDRSILNCDDQQRSTYMTTINVGQCVIGQTGTVNPNPQ